MTADVQADGRPDSARHHAVLARTTRVLVHATSRDSLFVGLARVLRDEVGAEGFAIYDASPRLRSARLEYEYGPGGIDVAAMASMFWTTAAGTVVESGEPAFITDMQNALGSAELGAIAGLRNAGINALAVLPLFIGGQALGVLSVRFAG